MNHRPKSDFTRAALYFADQTKEKTATVKSAYKDHKISLIRHWRKSQEITFHGMVRAGIYSLGAAALAIHNLPAGLIAGAALLSGSLYYDRREQKKLARLVEKDMKQRLENPRPHKYLPPRKPHNIHHPR